MQSRRDPQAGERHRTQIRRTEQFVKLVSGAREKLKLIYDSSPATHVSVADKAQQDAVKRDQKQHVIEDLRLGYARIKAEWGGQKDYDNWFNRSLNNAQLNTVDTYYHLVPAFRRLLAEKRGDLEAFYEAAATMGKLKKKERTLKLDSLLEAGR